MSNTILTIAGSIHHGDVRFGDISRVILNSFIINCLPGFLLIL